MFTQPLAVNEAAPFLFDFGGNPLVEGIERLEAADGAWRFDARGDNSLVVLRTNSLVRVPLQ
jgi:hypothetical protein